MAFKIVLLVALAAQIAAAGLALKLNHRYRSQSAWLFVSASALLMAVLHLTSLLDIWDRQIEVDDNAVLWTMSLTALLISMLMLGGMALIEPLFAQIEQAQRLLRQEKQQLESAVQATREEMRLAKDIQQNLLPDAPPDVPQLDVAGASQPAEWTSGDYFDYVPLAGGRFGFLVADASGHGTGPALLMSSARAFVRAFAAEYQDVAQLLSRVNDILSQDVRDSRFITMFLVSVDAHSHMASFVGAGQSAWHIRADGSSEELLATDPPLGVVPDRQLHSRQVGPLHSGDIFLLVTDGILETENDTGDMLGNERLLRAVIEHSNRSAEAIVQHIFRLTEEFAAGPQRDDITAVVVKFRN